MAAEDQVFDIPEDNAERSAAKLFGSGWPGASSRDGVKWTRWIKNRIDEQEPVMRDKRLHWSRHRNFRQQRQWISTRDGRLWREAGGEKNQIRATLDMIGPALDFRLSIINEQRPGFRTFPLGTGVHARETAEAQQMTAEHYYNKLNGLKLLRDAKNNAYTDGVSFLHVFVDRNAGPSREDVELVPPSDERYEMLRSQGYEVEEGGMLKLPTSESGDHMPVGSATERFREGDIATRVLLAHEVYADAEAKTINGPYDRAKWIVVRRVRDLFSARMETGNKELKPDADTSLIDPILDMADVTGALRTFQRGLPSYPMSRFRGRGNEPAVFEYLVFIAPAPEAGIEDGMWVRVLGGKVVSGGQELPGGKIPLAPVRDGSTDSDLFPRPVIASWLPDQISINALWSTLLNHARIFGTGRIMAQRGTIIEETYSDVVASVLEYVGSKPDYLPGTRAAGDTWKQLEMAIRKLEDKTGWNDIARGQVTGSGTLSDVSGRALLGAKELFERAFANDIRAAAEGLTEWSQLIVDYARWLFDEPRLIPVLGRGDLAKKIEAKDLGEETVVYVDAETLTPLPRALRNQLLVDMLDRGLITTEEFKRRSPFADVRNVTMGEQSQWERAQWVNTFLEENWQRMAVAQFIERYSPGLGAPVWWQDDPASHKRALEELVNDERKPVQLRDLAAERWGIYDQLALTKGGVDPASQQPIPGQPLAPPALFVIRGVPQHLGATQPLPSTAVAQPTGSTPGNFGAQGAPSTSATPDIAAVAQPALEAPALGAFGDAERAQQAEV